MSLLSDITLYQYATFTLKNVCYPLFGGLFSFFLQQDKEKTERQVIFFLNIISLPKDLLEGDQLSCVGWNNPGVQPLFLTSADTVFLQVA